ncbi:hypothetical protein [Ancylobacter rudongensis]|uniref:Uncharacterized protein n=1 Tax=Ancylobacter rudongensis TaxID=177413 RepID=A0A1G4USL7_9HYPH|nr:hypothetical protein [Ancylobacter rudongensis]SCW95975.1 hypothetical protein SAMN05660859_0163 [Ancylobacter rudongensis]
MSYRIHRGIGYGMPWAKFNELTALPRDENGASESLYSVFGSATDEQLTVPDEHYKELFYGESRRPVILEKRLLSETFTNGGREKAEIVSGHQLFQIVSTPDDTEHVMFFPNADYGRRWYRWDDMLDYQFEAYRDSVPEGDVVSRGDSCPPRDFANYLPYGHYPFANDLMLADGTPVAWNHFTIVERHPEWLPAVPSEIRWYLQKLGVLTDAGVNELRPLLAQWWG